MKISEFVNAYNAKNFMSTPQGNEEKFSWIKKSLEVKPYISFKDKRTIVEMVASTYTTEIDGIKKHDSMAAYVGFVAAMISSHTALEFSEDPISDYDLLAESGLLPIIIMEFKQDYDECDIMLKMAVASELEDNNLNVLVGHFLDGVLKKFDGMGDVLKNMLGNLDLSKVLGADIKPEDIAKLKGFLDKIK